ncbi:MAG: polysaccharide deacetylase family protein [Hyphomicrobium sp.]
MSPTLHSEPGATPQPLAQALTKPPAAPSAEKPVCADRTDLLGVSRVVEIDTTTGPRFGDQYLHRGETHFLEDYEVILTFDDGPLRRYTVPILDALDAQCTKATFFSVGRMAVADPAMLREVAARGHTIGTHTWSHKKLSQLGSAELKNEVELGLSAVAKAAGVPIAPFFRFPYLGDSKAGLAYVESRGIGIFGIHVDSSDFRTRSPGTVLRNVMSQLEHEKKGIILFHDIQPSTAGALTSMLAELKTRGFKIVHMIPKASVSTLPEYDAKAERALKGKETIATTSPLAPRAATWPVAGDVAAAANSEGTNTDAIAPASIQPTKRKQRPATSTDEDAASSEGSWFTNPFAQ